MCVFHTRTLLSCPTDANRKPPGLNLTSQTGGPRGGLVCVLMFVPVRFDRLSHQSLHVESAEHETRKRLSGENDSP